MILSKFCCKICLKSVFHWFLLYLAVSPMLIPLTCNNCDPSKISSLNIHPTLTPLFPFISSSILKWRLFMLHFFPLTQLSSQAVRAHSMLADSRHSHCCLSSLCIFSSLKAVHICCHKILLHYSEAQSRSLWEMTHSVFPWVPQLVGIEPINNAPAPLSFSRTILRHVVSTEIDPRCTALLGLLASLSLFPSPWFPHLYLFRLPSKHPHYI